MTSLQRFWKRHRPIRCDFLLHRDLRSVGSPRSTHGIACLRIAGSTAGRRVRAGRRREIAESLALAPTSAAGDCHRRRLLTLEAPSRFAREASVPNLSRPLHFRPPAACRRIPEKIRSVCRRRPQGKGAGCRRTCVTPKRGHHRTAASSMPATGERGPPCRPTKSRRRRWSVSGPGDARCGAARRRSAPRSRPVSIVESSRTRLASEGNREAVCAMNSRYARDTTHR